MERGLEENEIRSCRMKMKLPHIENEITKILKCVEYDHPELMHWNGDKFILEIENKEQNKFCLNLFYKEGRFHKLYFIKA